jgi:hypothetical protein
MAQKVRRVEGQYREDRPVVHHGGRDEGRQQVGFGRPSRIQRTGPGAANPARNHSAENRAVLRAATCTPAKFQP